MRIETKFDIGQEVYIIRDNQISREKIQNIGIWETGNTYDMDLEWEYRTLQCMACYVPECDIFPTKHEAEKRLLELQV